MNYVVGICCAVLTALVAFGVHKLDVVRLEDKQIKALAAQQKQLVAACDKAQKITEEVSHDYQEQLYALGRQLDHLKRVRTTSQCVPTTGGPAGRDGTPTGGKLSGTHGVRTDWLYDYAAKAEQVRLQLIACQNFIKKEREIDAKGKN